MPPRPPAATACERRSEEARFAGRDDRSRRLLTHRFGIMKGKLNLGWSSPPGAESVGAEGESGAVAVPVPRALSSPRRDVLSAAGDDSPRRPPHRGRTRLPTREPGEHPPRGTTFEDAVERRFGGRIGVGAVLAPAVAGNAIAGCEPGELGAGIGGDPFSSPVASVIVDYGANIKGGSTTGGGSPGETF